MVNGLWINNIWVAPIQLFKLAILMLFLHGTSAAKPPQKYLALDKLTYAAQAEAFDEIQAMRLTESDELSLLWLTVLEAKALYHLNKFSESQTLLINVESQAEDLNDSYLNELVLRQMGQNFYRMGGFDQAMTYALKAQLIAEQNDLMWEQAQLTNLIAAVHLRSGAFNLALAHFSEALTYFESIDAKNDVAKLKNNLAAVYIETNQFKLARLHLDDALSLAAELDRPTTLISALVNQIELYVKLGDFEAATESYQTCLSHAANENLSSFEVWCLEAGAQMYQQQGAYVQAIELANTAYQMAGDQKLFQSQINLGKVLVELYAQTQQFQMALSVSSLNLTQVESIKDEVLKLKLEEVSALNDVERTRFQLQFEREQNKLYLKNQRLTWTGIAILIPILLFTLLLLVIKQRLVKALHAQQNETNIALAKMQEAKEVNEKLARTDALTGLCNRREMSRIIESICIADELEEGSYLLMVDVDFFKNINDKYGHAVGDKVLVELAQYITDLMPEGTSCARWGGEEFLLLLQQHSLEQAINVAQNLVRTVAAKTMAGAQSISITLSIGLSEKHPGQTMDSWIDRADQALYESKHNGRNQVTVNV